MADGHTEVAAVLSTPHTLVITVLDVLIIKRFSRIDTFITSSPSYYRIFKLHVTATAWVKTRVCDHSLAGIAGSNPAGNMHVCLL